MGGQASWPLVGRTTGIDRRDATVGSSQRSARTVLAGVCVGSVAGLVAAWLTPRGPITTADAIGWVVVSFAIGVAAGFIGRSRWTALTAVAACIVAFELGRLGTDGPTVDAINLRSTYGIIAFVVGRGLSYVLAVLPLVTGVLLGVELAARMRRPDATRLGWLGWLLLVAGVMTTLGLGWNLLRPATTAPIVGAGGAALPGSIAELTRVELGGHEQALMIRGRDSANPVLLHLAGGPGGTDLGAMRADTSLEDDFVVVTWEQRGVGKSYAALDPVATLTPEQLVADTIELSEYLADRFGQERIYLHGNSWGSLLGVLAVQQRPDLFHAWIGSGQMVHPPETDRMFWEDTIAWAEATGNEPLAATLRENGPPPYDAILDYEPALSHEHDWNPYAEWDSDGELPFTLFVPENTLMDQVNGLRSFLDTFGVLYPRIQGIDLRRDAAHLEVPVVLVVGAHEARGRAVLADAWFETLEAPSKRRVVFEASGHRPSFEEPARFAALMQELVSEATSDAPGTASLMR